MLSEARIKTPDLTAGRSFNASATEASHELAALHDIINRRKPCRLEDGMLTITLHRDFFVGGSELFSAIRRDPGISKNIQFDDRGVIRPCDDVLYDMQARGLDLARQVYKDGKQARRYIVLTPPALGFDGGAPNHIHCRTQNFKGSRSDVMMQVEIRTETDFWSAERKKGGQSHVIQSDKLELTRNADDWSSLKLSVQTRAGLCGVFEPMTVPRKFHAPAP